MNSKTFVVFETQIFTAENVVYFAYSLEEALATKKEREQATQRTYGIAAVID